MGIAFKSGYKRLFLLPANGCTLFSSISMRWFNSLAKAPPPRPVVGDDDDFFENTLPEQYDINSYIPIPAKPLENWLIRYVCCGYFGNETLIVRLVQT
jgi:hypothetical protein